MMINISNLNKAFLDKPVLRDVSFHLEEKEKAAIVGINGSGKTTLLRCILGEEEPDSGMIAFAKGKKIGYLAQQHADMAQDDREYDILSGGQKTKKRLEEILLDKPELLILDEPTVGVDAQSRQHIFDYIQSLAEQGTTILYTSHYMEEIETLCKRVFILDLGEEVAYGTKEEVKKLVGHTQTVSLTLDRVPAGFDEVLKNSENGIQFVTVNGQDIALTIDQTIFSMMKLIEQVEQAQLVIKSVNVKETTLEEAFLQLTGKTLRD